MTKGSEDERMGLR